MVCARFLRLYLRIVVAPPLCASFRGGTFVRDLPQCLLLCLSFPWWCRRNPPVDHSILVHRLFFSSPSPPVSHAFMHYKYLQISRVPYSIERRRRSKAKSAEAAGATERRRRALLFGRCLPRLYGGGPVCVHTSSLQLQNGYRCTATTWSQIHPRIFHFLSWIWFNGDSAWRAEWMIQTAWLGDAAE